MPDQEPFFISQNNELTTPTQRISWIRAEAAKASEQGATFSRASVHPEDSDILLFEAWKKRPEDQGEPRFHLSKVDQKT